MDQAVGRPEDWHESAPLGSKSKSTHTKGQSSLIFAFSFTLWASGNASHRGSSSCLSARIQSNRIIGSPAPVASTAGRRHLRLEASARAKGQVEAEEAPVPADDHHFHCDPIGHFRWPIHCRTKQSSLWGPLERRRPSGCADLCAHRRRVLSLSLSLSLSLGSQIMALAAR